MHPTHQGSCLCGAVRYDIRSELGPTYFCHCSRCRKANGSAFATNALVAAEHFTITAGDDHLRTFSTPAGVHRVFCGSCGSPLFSHRDQLPGQLRLRIGSLDTPIRQGPRAHIFTASKAAWYQIRDELPQHADRLPPTV